MESDEEKILNAIQEDVRANARLVQEEVEKEAANREADQLSFYQEGLKKQTDTYLEKELSDLRLYAAAKASRDKLAAKKELLALRQKLEDELFAQTAGDLQAFLDTEEYDRYLARQLDTLPVNGSGVFLVRAADQQRFQALLKQKGRQAEVQTAVLPLGGFRYRDEANGVEYSCDLARRLEEQRDWFHSHSGFHVSQEAEHV